MKGSISQLLPLCACLKGVWTWKELMVIYMVSERYFYLNRHQNLEFNTESISSLLNTGRLARAKLKRKCTVPSKMLSPSKHSSRGLVCQIALVNYPTSARKHLVYWIILLQAGDSWMKTTVQLNFKKLWYTFTLSETLHEFQFWLSITLV